MNDLRCEQEKFCEQLEKVAKSLAYLVNAKLNGMRDVEDVYQETILAAWYNRHTLLDSGSFKSWIFQIARNKCNDYFRKRGRNYTLAFEEVEQIIADRFGLRGALLDEQKELVRDELGDLSPYDKELIELVYYKELNLTQVAQKMSIPLGTVKRRLFDARNRLRKQVTERND